MFVHSSFMKAVPIKSSVTGINQFVVVAVIVQFHRCYSIAGVFQYFTPLMSS